MSKLRAIRALGPNLPQARSADGALFVRGESHDDPLHLSRGYEIRAETGATVVEEAVNAKPRYTLKGNPSLMGTPYSIGYCSEVIFPGAFEGSLERFRKEGFIAQGHEWDELPIAFPTLIEERGSALYSEAVYHSTESGQNAATVAMERLAAGLTVGLSIGFFLDYEDYLWFESGQKLLDYATNNGYDLKLFDKKALKALDSWVIGIVRVARLVEYSQVTIPANDGAGLDAVTESMPEPDPAPTAPPDGGATRDLRADDERIRSFRLRALLGKTPKENV